MAGAEVLARPVGGPGWGVPQLGSGVRPGPVGRVWWGRWWRSGSGWGSVDAAGLSDAERVDLVGELERVKGASSAVQARATDALRCSREVVAPADVARSVGSQVALARRESPGRGDRFVGLSRALVHEMPATSGALTGGVTVGGTRWRWWRRPRALSVGDRAEVDRRVGPVLGRLGVAAAGRAAARVAAELDAASVVACGWRRRSGRAGSRCGRLRTGWPTSPCSLRCARASGPTPRCEPGPPRWWPGSAPTRRPRAAGSGR